jgi:hypothetical protein
MGQRASFGIGQFNSFWAYTTPIIGAIIADEYLGRFNTIFIAIAFSIIGHILLIVSAIPAVLTSGNAIGPFILGVITLGFGTGAFKSNISPLIAEQYRQTKPRVVIDPKTGARVISDPNITLSRIFLYFYMVSHPINPAVKRSSVDSCLVYQHRCPHRSNLHGLRGKVCWFLVRLAAPHHHVLLLSDCAVDMPKQVPPHPTYWICPHPRHQALEARGQGQVVAEPRHYAQELQGRQLLGRCQA